MSRPLQIMVKSTGKLTQCIQRIASGCFLSRRIWAKTGGCGVSTGTTTTSSGGGVAANSTGAVPGGARPGVLPAPFFSPPRVLAGHPPAVIPMDPYPADETLQAIAAENNLAAPAFLLREGGDYRLRWFTPATEVPLCGHATLASAAVVMERLEPGRTSVVFHSASGPLTVHRMGAGYVMDFPARPSERIAPPPGLAEALGAFPVEVFGNAFNYLALLESSQILRQLAHDMAAIARIDRPCVIVTVSGDQQFDFIS